MSDDAQQRSWYLLTSKPSQDQKAQEQLENQGYVVYRPMAVRNRSRRGKMVKVSESLFPRYMFIYLDTKSDNWAPIKSTFGVSGIVKFGQEPAKVPDSLIKQLLASTEHYQDQLIDLDNFKEGDRVVMNDGPFQGLGGVFKSHAGEERVIILLNILSKETRVAIPGKDVRKFA